MRSCLSTASNILRFPIFISEVFCSASRPDLGKIRRITRLGVSEEQSARKLSFTNQPRFVAWRPAFVDLCWEFEVKPLSLPNGSTCSWRLSVGIYARSGDGVGYNQKMTCWMSSLCGDLGVCFGFLFSYLLPRARRSVQPTRQGSQSSGLPDQGIFVQ